MIALLCPGQGSQFVGMGRDLADTFPEARELFERADDTLEVPLSRLCWEGPEAELTQTVNAQPAILVHTLAVWEVLRRRAPISVGFAAGHSLGEFSAYALAGSLSEADAVRLVRIRGEAMHRAGSMRKGAMAAILGLDDDDARRVCDEASGPDSVVVPANFNSPGQIVVSGDAAAVARLEPLARDAGAKRVIPLNVSGAFHSPLMTPAAAQLESALAAVPLGDPAFPIVSNVVAEPVRLGSAAGPLLVRQLTSPVRWVESVRALVGLGVDRFIEIGPGNVLTGLLRRIDREAAGQSIGTVAEVEGVLAGSGVDR